MYQKHFITIIGAGKFGTALASVITKSQNKSDISNHINLCLYDITEDHIPDFCNFTIDLSKALFCDENTLQYTLENTNDINKSQIKHWIITAIPANQILSTLDKISAFKLSNPTVILVSKGTNSDGSFISTAIEKRFSNQFSLCFLAGPHFAHDLMNQSSTITIIGCEKENKSDLQNFFHNINPAFTTDVLGIQIACVMKNMSAFCCGASAGLGMSESTKGTIFALCLEDTKKLLTDNKCDYSTLLSPPIIADWFMCCASNTSRNYQAGYDFAYYNKAPENYLAESVKSIEAFYQYLEANSVYIPGSIGFVYACIKKQNIKQAMEAFLNKSIANFL